jgi:phage-related protein (TIGR01555 family)
MNNNRRKFNNDSISRLYSLIGGIGTTQYDPLETTSVNPPPRYSRQELCNAYRSLWMCRKVCDFLPNQMAREWGKMSLPDNVELENRINRQLNSIKKVYREGQKMANLYGGAIVVRIVEDNKDYSEPIFDIFGANGKASIQNVQYSRIYSPWEIFPFIDTSSIGVTDLTNPEYYQCSLADNATKNMTFKIHRDRILRFRGAPIDYESLKLNRGFEDSLLTPFIEPCLRYLTALSYVGATVKSFEFVVHSLDNLFGELENPESQQHLAERLSTAYQALGALRGLVIDKKEEDVEVISRSYAGVKDVLDLLLGEMIAASGLTKPQLIQEHPAGLAATGESERLAEAEQIRALQEEKWGENINFDCKLHLVANKYSRDNWLWKWNNLFQQTPSEEADMHLKQAQADQIRIDSGVVDAQEIRKMRFDNLQETI